jgi:hypothetical protein
MRSSRSGWDLAEWLEPLTVNAEVATVLGSIPASSLRHSGIWGAADEAVLNTVHVHRRRKKSKKSPPKFLVGSKMMLCLPRRTTRPCHSSTSLTSTSTTTIWPDSSFRRTISPPRFVWNYALLLILNSNLFLPLFRILVIQSPLGWWWIRYAK